MQINRQPHGDEDSKDPSGLNTIIEDQESDQGAQSIADNTIMLIMNSEVPSDVINDLSPFSFSK